MLDLNTSYKAERSITIKLSFKQNEQRDDIKAHIDVKEKLAPEAAIETSFSFAKDLETGEIMVEEYGKQIKGQLSFKDVQSELKVVDTETGEILENNNVVDLRKKA